MDINTVALLLAAVALAASLLSIALSLRIGVQAQTNAQGENSDPRLRPIMIDEDESVAWYGNVTDGYVRGPFVIRRMPTLGPEAARGNETEWVAYANGDRVANSQDLAEVMGWCEGLE